MAARATGRQRFRGARGVVSGMVTELREIPQRWHAQEPVLGLARYRERFYASSVFYSPASAIAAGPSFISPSSSIGGRDQPRSSRPGPWRCASHTTDVSSCWSSRCLRVGASRRGVLMSATLSRTMPLLPLADKYSRSIGDAASGPSSRWSSAARTAQHSPRFEVEPFRPLTAFAPLQRDQRSGPRRAASPPRVFMLLDEPARVRREWGTSGRLRCLLIPVCRPRAGQQGRPPSEPGLGSRTVPRCQDPTRT